MVVPVLMCFEALDLLISVVHVSYFWSVHVGGHCFLKPRTKSLTCEVSTFPISSQPFRSGERNQSGKFEGIVPFSPSVYLETYCLLSLSSFLFITLCLLLCSMCLRPLYRFCELCSFWKILVVSLPLKKIFGIFLSFPLLFGCRFHHGSACNQRAKAFHAFLYGI